MTQDEISAEYSAAKDEYEKAEAALARAHHRLHLASNAMCQAWDKLWREAEDRKR